MSQRSTAARSNRVTLPMRSAGIPSVSTQRLTVLVLTWRSWATSSAVIHVEPDSARALGVVISAAATRGLLHELVELGLQLSDRLGGDHVLGLERGAHR